MPTGLLPAAGFAALVAVGGLITCFPSIAEATTAVTVALAVTGFVAAWPLGGRDFSWWPVLAAVGVFLMYGAPVIASGEATFAGYIKLDDTSTWLAFTDHVLTYGHGTGGLNPSSYEAVVQINLSAGYPLGAFIPLGVGHELTGMDAAWLFQPYMALMAALMALVFSEVARPVIPDVRTRAAVVFVAAQPALLIGYAFWGGLKEVATALLVATLAASAAWLADPDRSVSLRSAIPVPVAAGAALIGVMGLGGVPWLIAVAIGVLVLVGIEAATARRGRGGAGTGRPVPRTRTFLMRAGLAGAGIALVGLPTVLAAGQFFSPDQGPLTSGEELGNLIGPLSPAQYVGPWPVGDFRVEPGAVWVTVMLVGAGLIGAGVGLYAALLRRSWPLLLLVAGTGLGSLIVWSVGSPWVQGKALAAGAASFLLLAMVGIAVLLTEPRLFAGKGKGEVREQQAPDRYRRESAPTAGLLRTLRLAGALLLVVPAGVLASTVLAYDEAWLAPRAQLAELERIGEDFAGQGPALMTEYQPYGVRHFLRQLDAEGSSELRRRSVPRRDGSEAQKGAWSDTDELVLDPAREGLLTYRTLVLRRSPWQSRPPSPYVPVRRGEYYDVWQRPGAFDSGDLIVHRSFGTPEDPGATPACARIAAVASKAGPVGTVVAAPAPETATSDFTDHPSDWVPDPAAGTLTPLSDGSAGAEVTLPSSGEWRVWIGGSVRGEVSVTINGVEAGSVRNRLNNHAQFIELDRLTLERGLQRIEVDYRRGGMPRPATGAYPFGIGPVVLTRRDRQDRLIRLPSADSDRLCGRRLDWVEGLR